MKLSRQDLLRCLAVSAVLSIVSPLFTVTMGTLTVSPPGEAMEVPDFGNVQLEGTGSQPPAVAVNAPGGMKTVTGFEKFIYPFTVPGAWRFYLSACLTVFVIALVASVAVTVWGNMKRLGA